MISSMVERVRSIHRTVTRVTLGPLLVRCGVFLSALLALVLAYPVEVLTGRAAGPLLLVAVLPALAPRRAWPTLAMLVAVAGWVLATSGYGEPIALWRLIGLAGCLYLTHSLAALAALLPSDVVVTGELIARWVLRALGVVLAAAVAAVLLLAVAGRVGDRALLGAALGGLAVAVLAAALLVWLARRRQPTNG